MQTFAQDPSEESGEAVTVENSETQEGHTFGIEMKEIKKGRNSKGDEKKEEEIEEKEEEAEEQGLMKIWALNKPEICYNIVGSFIAFLLGVLQPIFAFVFAGVMGSFGHFACSYDQDIAQFVNNATNATIISAINPSGFIYCSLNLL